MKVRSKFLFCRTMVPVTMPGHGSTGLIARLDALAFPVESGRMAGAGNQEDFHAGAPETGGLLE